MENPHIKLSNALHFDNVGEARGNGELLLRRGIPDEPFVSFQMQFVDDRMGLTFQKMSPAGAEASTQLVR
jgi:hypothetical protein